MVCALCLFNIHNEKNKLIYFSVEAIGPIVFQKYLLDKSSFSAICSCAFVVVYRVNSLLLSLN